jgi:hypothetical protein
MPCSKGRRSHDVCGRSDDKHKNRKRHVRSSREHDHHNKKACGSATLDFWANKSTAKTCLKYYLIIVSTAISFPNTLPDETWAQANKPLYALVAPIDATSVSVTWNFIETTPNNLSRYVITVERDTGCTFVPIAKFQVPVSMVPINDCELVGKSNTNGASRSHAVKICAGDLLVVNILRFLAEDCPVQCGAPAESNAPTGSSALNTCFISVYLA